jgi:hypothetical protein
LAAEYFLFVKDQLAYLFDLTRSIDLSPNVPELVYPRKISSQMIDSFLNHSRQTFLLIDHCKPFYAYLPPLRLEQKLKCAKTL